jgi:hypothetical protein
VPRAVTLPADLEAELDKVRKAAPPPPSDDPIYTYLRRVYRLRQKLESSPKWKKAIQEYHTANRLRIEKNYIRFIIQRTSGDHVKDGMKNKYNGFQRRCQTAGRNSLYQKAGRFKQVS